MTAFLVAVAVLPLLAMNAALLYDRFRSEAAHRLERERLTRALLARNMPEFGAITKIIEGDRGAETRRRITVPNGLGGEWDGEMPGPMEGT